MTEIILEPLDDEDEPPIRLGNINIGGGFVLEPVDGQASAPEGPAPGGFTDTMGFVNRGVVDTLGAIPDLLTYPIRAPFEAITGMEMESPSNTVSDLMRGLGIEVAEQGRPAETTGQRIGEFVGAAAGGVGALGAPRAAANAGQMFAQSSIGQRLLSALGRGGGASSAASGAPTSRIMSMLDDVLAPYVARPVRSVGQDMAAATGAAVAGQAATDMDAEAVGRSAGESLGRVFDTVLPGTSLLDLSGATEAAGDLGASAGRNAPPELLQLGGELVGGVAGAAAGPATLGAARGGLSASTRIPAIGIGSKILQHAIDPTEGQQRMAREALLNQIGGRPEDVMRSLNDDTILPLTFAQRTGEPGLIKAEQDILKTNPRLEAEYKAQRERIFQTADDEISAIAEGGSAQTAAERIGDWVSSSKAMLEVSAEEALAQARRDILEAGSPSADQADLSLMFRTRLGQTYDRVKQEEAALWGQVPEVIAGPTSASQAALESLKDRSDTVLDADLPDRALRFFDPKYNDDFEPQNPDFLGDTASSRQLQNLYSHFRRVQREAAGGANPNSQLAAYARDMANGVLTDLNSIAASNQQFNAARTYTRNLHDVFDEGDIGAVLGTSKDGSERVMPEMALQRLLGGSGSRLVGQRTILDDALGPFTPTDVPDAQAMSIADAFVARRFQDAALPDQYGDPVARRATNFVNDNQAFIRRYPELGERLTTAAQSARAADQTQKDVTEQLTALAQSPEARFSSARIYDEFTEMLNGTRPAQDVAQLRRTAEELGPEALDGVRASATDYLLKMMRDYDPDIGSDIMTAKKVMDPDNRGLRDPATMDALGELFEPEQLQHLDRVASELARVDMSVGQRRGGTTRLIGTDAEDTMLTLIARTVGLFGFKAFTPPGMGTVQGPTVGANAAQYLKNVMTTGSAEDMVHRAILQRTPEDAQLLEALLMPASATSKIPEAAQRIFDSWLRSAGYTQAVNVESAVQEFRDALGIPQDAPQMSPWVQ